MRLTKVGTVDVDDACIAGLVDAFIVALERLGDEVVATRILFDSEAGFEASLMAASGELADAGVEGVFFPFYPARATPFLQQLPAAPQVLPLISADVLSRRTFSVRRYRRACMKKKRGKWRVVCKHVQESRQCQQLGRRPARRSRLRTWAGHLHDAHPLRDLGHPLSVTDRSIGWLPSGHSGLPEGSAGHLRRNP